MDINQTVTDSLAATAESKRQKMLAGQLASQARFAIGVRAEGLAEDIDEYDNIGGIPSKVVKTWESKNGSIHRIIVQEFRGSTEVKSIVNMPTRPSGRPTSVQRLQATPLEHLAEHFGPLMGADYMATVAI